MAEPAWCPTRMCGAALATALALFGPASVTAQDDARMSCAAEAASPFQPGFEAIGRDQDQIDPEMAIAACQTALEAHPNDPMVQGWLGRAYFVARDFDLMVPHLEHSAQGGDPMGQQILGTAYAAGYGVEADQEAALALFVLSADQGYASGQYSLGFAHLWGEGTVQDPALAAEYFELAAQAGLPIAQLELGALLLEGTGVEPDPDRAADLFLQAAQAGNAQAMYNLGYLHMVGWAVEPDDLAAIDWFGQAAEKGHGPAASALASYHIDGSVIPEDPVEAERLATLAAQANDDYGHYLLGYLAQYGIGRAADIDAAIAHYETALALGSPEAEQALEDLSDTQ